MRAKSPQSAPARMGLSGTRVFGEPTPLWRHHMSLVQCRTSGAQAAAPVHLVRRAVEMACANNACIAAVMSPSVVTVKNMPVEAQLSKFGLIWF